MPTKQSIRDAKLNATRLETREKVARHRAEKREIGKIPRVTKRKLRSECDASLRKFLVTCFPEIFDKPFSPMHLELISRIEWVVNNGGNEAFACERGFGKTQISIGSVTWATLTGRSKYALIVGANADMAINQRNGIKRRLETSQPLYELYPEICYPMRTLAGSLKLMATHNGELIRIQARPDLVLPCIAGAPGSQAVIGCTGIDSGSIRGRYYDRADGTTVRPDFVMLDDPQDDEVATQAKTIEKRSRKIRGAVQGMSGPGKKFAVLMPCTIIAKNDLAYEFTDRTQRPEWNGQRVKAMPSMPSDLDADQPLWHQYDELRREDLAMGDKTRARATAMFLENQEPMSRGSVITWPDRVEANCVNALQSLMDKFLTDRLSFMAEQQQSPEGDEDLSIYLDTPGIAKRFNGLRRQQVPPSAKITITGIDVQEHLLYWLQTVWSEELTGWIIDRGTFPKQPVADFHHLHPPRTLSEWARKQFPQQSLTWEERMQHAIRACVSDLPVYGGLDHGPVVIDNRWHKAQKAVEQVASETPYRGTLVPAGGSFVGGNDIAFSARKMPEGSKRISTDVEWYIKRVDKATRILLFDANYYRSQVQKGLAAEPGTRGSITYNGIVPDNVLAAHLGARAVTIPTDTKRTVEVWKNKPGNDQDHWGDCAVMCRVGVEVAGYRLNGVRFVKKTQRKKPLTQEDVDAMRKGGR